MTRVDACTNQLRESKVLSASNVQDLENIDGKPLNKDAVFNYNKEFDKRRKLYVQSVADNNSFIKAELNFAATKFLK